MTDQNKRGENQTVKHVRATGSSESTVSHARRSLIKGAAGSLPMILTLQSGAALARSSNLISTASPEAATDQYGRTLCMDRGSVYAADGAQGEMYDLGEPAHARVAAIRDRKYYWHRENEGFGEISESEMCEKGGTYYYKRRWGWRQVNVRQGMLVSATALSSFAGKVDIIDI